MLTYHLSTSGKDPLYQQLYQAIREDIERGILQSGQRLPSKRALANHLQISVVTVENAYRQLVAEGYLQAVAKRGFFVNHLPAPQSFTLGSHLTPNTSFQLQPISAAEEEKTAQSSVVSKIDLTGATGKQFSLPYSTWAKALRSTLTNQPETQLLGTSSFRGTRRLREAITRYLYGNRGLMIDPEQIVVAAGAQTLYQLIIQLLGTKLNYGLEDPGYPRLSKIYHSWDLNLHYLPLDSQGVSITALTKTPVEVLHLMPSHQFPTGLVTSIGRRYQLLSWVQQDAQRFIIEDDYDCEIRFQGRPIPSLYSIDQGQKVIYTNTFTNTLGGAFRLAYMILPPGLAEKFTQNLGFYSSTVSVLEQLSLAALLENGQFERHLNRLRSHYRNLAGQLRVMFQEVNQQLGQKTWQLYPSDGGVHVPVCYLGDKYSGAQLQTRLLAHGVKIQIMSEFVQGASNRRQELCYPVSERRETVGGTKIGSEWPLSSIFVLNFSTLSQAEISALGDVLRLVAQ